MVSFPGVPQEAFPWTERGTFVGTIPRHPPLSRVTHASTAAGRFTWGRVNRQVGVSTYSIKYWSDFFFFDIERWPRAAQ